MYNLGFQANAQPYSALERSHKDFRFSLSQRMLYNDQQSKKRTVSQLNDQRQQLTSLNPSSSSPNVSNFQHAQNNYTPPPPMIQQQNACATPLPPQEQPQQEEQEQQLQQQHEQQTQQQHNSNQPPQQQPYQNQQSMQYPVYNTPTEEQQPPAKKFRGTEEQRTYNKDYTHFSTQPTEQVDYNRKNDSNYNNQYAETKNNSDDLNNSTSTACAIASSLNSVYSGDEDGSEDYAYNAYNEAVSNIAETTKYTNETMSYTKTNISAVEQSTQLGIMLPPNFARYAKNHHDTWSWPIFLDEPDTNKVCKYPRHLVYPGNGCEYSLEEIRGRNYTKVIESIKERNRQRDIALYEERRINQMQNEHQHRYDSQQSHPNYGNGQQQYVMRQQQFEEPQALERQKMAEIEEERSIKERERSRLAALEMQRAKQQSEQQQRLAEQQKMQQMQEQAAFAQQVQLI